MSPNYELIRELVRERVAVILQEHGAPVPHAARFAIAMQAADGVCHDLLCFAGPTPLNSHHEGDLK